MSERYPTEDELDKIKSWDAAFGVRGWFDLVKEIWWNPEWGWSEKDDKLEISTGGWSGNEDLIGAMQENFICWNMTWESTRRGGHYTFLIKES